MLKIKHKLESKFQVSTELQILNYFFSYLVKNSLLILSCFFTVGV